MDTLVLIDVLDSHGMMLSRQRLVLQNPGPPLVIGRDLACDVVLNDPYVAARHAALSLREGETIGIADLGTINGLIVGDERVRQATITGPTGTNVQVGHSHLRIRTAADALAAERPDLESLRSRYWEYAVAVIGGVACAGFAGFTAWIGSPDDTAADFVNTLLRGAAILAVWFALWVSLGRAVRSRWQWSGNAAIALGATALCLWLWWAADVATFASGMARLRWLGANLIAVVAAVTIYLHLRRATRLARLQSAVIATVIPVVASLAYLWFQQQYAVDTRYVTPPGKIFPPSWSRQPGVRLDKFFDESLDLRDAADQQRMEAR